MVLVVILHGGKAHRQRAGIAKGAQTHVDPEHLAIHGGLMQHIDQLLSQTDKEGLVINAAPSPLGLAILGKAEDEIDIGGEVELTAAQLAHAQHLQLLRLSFGTGRSPLLAAGLVIEPGKRLAYQLLGQQGEMGKALLHLGKTSQLAPGDDHHLLAAETAQGALELLLAAHRRKQVRQTGAILLAPVGLLQLTALEYLQQQFGAEDGRIGDKIGEAKQRTDLLGQRQKLLALSVVTGRQQTLPLAFSQLDQRGRELHHKRPRHQTEVAGNQ